MVRSLSDARAISLDPGACGGFGVASRPLRILHVEDDDIDAEIVAHFLQAMDGPALHVDRVASVAEAVARIETGAYDLCLLDYWLGAQSSLHVVARIDASGRSTPIVLLSGATGLDARDFALMAGASSHVSKQDLTAARLAQAIETALSKPAPPARA
jgi:CheY-like chemotaxis protein